MFLRGGEIEFKRVVERVVCGYFTVILVSDVIKIEKFKGFCYCWEGCGVGVL